MKIPKLKYYYYAMSSDAYIDFATTRKLNVDATLTIDILTGAVTGSTILVLGDSTQAVDDQFRSAHNWTKPVYVLRIPRELVKRDKLKPVTDHLYEYRDSLVIEHCGVERFELATES